MTASTLGSVWLWTAIAAAILVGTGALALWFGGPPLLRRHVARRRRSRAAAQATGLGLRLTDADTIVYARHSNHYPNPGAYLIIDSASPERAAELRANAGLGPGEPGRPFAGAGPRDSPTLRRAQTAAGRRGELRANWDPAADGGRRTYLWVVPARRLVTPPAREP